MSDIDIALHSYNDLKLSMEEHEKREPIGLQYTKEDKYYWSYHFHQISKDIIYAKTLLITLLDRQLEEYFGQTKAPPTVNTWNKRSACIILKERLGLHFSVSIKELFLYVGHSVMCIPQEHKQTVINHFAYALDDLGNTDIDAIREAVKNIGFKMEERCYDCNELMPEFEGTGYAICPDCI